MNKTRIIIPSRMKSERLPNKPLAMIGNKTLIEHAYISAKKTEYPITILTDSLELKEKFPNWDIRITSEDCATGTDRIASVAELFEEDIIINYQGDLPFINPKNILDVVHVLEKTDADVATLVFEMDPTKQNDPNTVKAICSPIDSINQSDIMRSYWFLRAPITYGYQHVGIYAYFKEKLKLLPSIQTKLEKIEKLEQLRWLELGYKIVALKVDPVPMEINTPEDLEIANKYFR